VTFYLTTYTTHTRQTPVPFKIFELTIAAKDGTHTYVLDHTINEIGIYRAIKKSLFTR
jgi:hypothetical protein